MLTGNIAIEMKIVEEPSEVYGTDLVEVISADYAGNFIISTDFHGNHLHVIFTNTKHP
jgi:hypothetical protein